MTTPSPESERLANAIARLRTARAEANDIIRETRERRQGRMEGLDGLLPPWWPRRRSNDAGDDKPGPNQLDE